MLLWRQNQRGPFNFSGVPDDAPLKGNGASSSFLTVPMVHRECRSSGPRGGFTVAIPQHHGDNYLDSSEPRPVSWRKRPQAISEAIDRVGQHAALSSLLSRVSVGAFGVFDVFGGSAADLPRHTARLRRLGLFTAS